MSTSLRSIVRLILREDTAAQQIGTNVYAGIRDVGRSQRDDDDDSDLDSDAEAGDTESGMRLDDSPITGVSPKDEEEWRKRVMDFALKYKDVPYEWGGQTPRAFDCSGFAWYVLKNSGLAPVLRRETSGQQMQLGRPISKEQLRYGDLVGFKTAQGAPSHIGFYLSGTKYLSALGGNSTTTLANPKLFKDGSRARVMEYDFTRDNRPQYYASLSNLIAKRLKEDEGKGLVASAEKDQQKKGEEKKTG